MLVASGAFICSFISGVGPFPERKTTEWVLFDVLGQHLKFEMFTVCTSRSRYCLGFGQIIAAHEMRFGQMKWFWLCSWRDWGSSQLLEVKVPCYHFVFTHLVCVGETFASLFSKM